MQGSYLFNAISCSTLSTSRRRRSLSQQPIYLSPPESFRCRSAYCTHVRIGCLWPRLLCCDWDARLPKPRRQPPMHLHICKRRLKLASISEQLIRLSAQADTRSGRSVGAISVETYSFKPRSRSASSAPVMVEELAETWPTASTKAFRACVAMVCLSLICCWFCWAVWS